jgi:hypothetical protein
MSDLGHTSRRNSLKAGAAAGAGLTLAIHLPGCTTGIAMLAAEELDADWPQDRFEQAAANEAYYNPIIGSRLTGGSTGIRAAFPAASATASWRRGPRCCRCPGM